MDLFANDTTLYIVKSSNSTTLPFASIPNGGHLVASMHAQQVVCNANFTLCLLERSGHQLIHVLYKQQRKQAFTDVRFAF